MIRTLETQYYSRQGEYVPGIALREQHVLIDGDELPDPVALQYS
jgi:hypothetical protein